MLSLQRLRALVKASDAISIGDMVNCRVRRYNNWGLMPFGALMGSVVPTTYMRGRREIFEQHEQVCLARRTTLKDRRCLSVGARC